MKRYSRCCLSPLSAAFLCILCFSHSLLGSEVTLLEGDVLKQDITTFDEQSLRLAERPEPIPWGEIDRIVFKEALSTEAQEPASMVLLKDGSYLGVSAISGIRNGLSVESAYGTIDLPLGVLVAWGKQAWIEAQRAQPNDVVLLEGSEISGEIQGIADGNVMLKTDLSPDAIPLPLTGILGVHLAIPVEQPRGIYLTSSTSDQAAPVILVPTAKGLVLQSLPKQVIPRELVNEVTVHGGRRVFLSDLKPSLVNEEGAFGVVWNYSTNQNIDGSPLILGGKRHQRGIVIHSKAELEWPLDGAYTTFSCDLGIVDLLGREGDCSVRILGDGKVLWEEQSVRGGQDPHQLSLAVDDIKTLRVEIGYGARYDIGDHLALANAWLLKK